MQDDCNVLFSLPFKIIFLTIWMQENDKDIKNILKDKFIFINQ